MPVLRAGALPRGCRSVPHVGRDGVGTRCLQGLVQARVLRPLEPWLELWAQRLSCGPPSLCGFVLSPNFTVHSDNSFRLKGKVIFQI